MAGTVVICFTDIVGSTALLTRVGDDAFDALRRSHFDLLAHEVTERGGEMVKNLGDGAMVAFGSASDAVGAAVAMQRAAGMVGRRAGADAIEIRIGISAGDALEEDGDWFGSPVVEGARLCAAADAGQILVGEVVRLLAGSRGGHEFRSVGDLDLKGLPEPVAASEVLWTTATVELTASLPAPLELGEADLPFSGRSTSLDELHQAWKATSHAEAQLVMVAGEPGVGKTRLVAEFAQVVHDEGAVVLLGRADEHVDAPYGPWREAIRRLVRTAPDEILEAHVAEVGGELLRLVPELARRVDGIASPTDSDPETERLLLFESIAGLIASMSEVAPVLLVLDDLHWADRSSLLLLLHLLRMDRPATLLVVATYRDTDVDRSHPLAAVLADLRRVRGAIRMALGGLDRDGVIELLTAAGGQDLDEEAREFAATLTAETEGNPFFLGEVLRHLIEAGGLVQVDGRWQASATLAETGLPEGVREVIGRRLAGQADDTNMALGVASILGREFDVSMVATVADLSVAEVCDALAPAEAARLIVEVPGRPGRYSFAHALVRTTLVEELGTNRRIRMHRAAGLAWEAMADPPIGELAYHFGEAAVMGETERAVRYARAAAQEALDLAAPEDAAAGARRALQALELGEGSDLDRVDLLLLLARAMTDAGVPGSMDAVADAFSAAADVGDWSLAAEAAILCRAGTASVFHDRRALAQVDRALEAIEAGDSELRARLLARSSTWRVVESGDRCARDASEAHRMALRIGSVMARHEAATAAALAFRNLDRVAMLAFAEEALELRRGTFTSDTFVAYGHKLEALLGLGDLEGLARAIDEFGQAFDASPVRGVRSFRASKVGTEHHATITVALLRGRLDDAECAIASAEADETMSADTMGPTIAVEFGRTQVSYLRGDWSAAVDGWKRTKTILPGASDVYFGFTGVGCPLPDLQDCVDAWFEIDETRPEVTEASNVAVVAEALRRLGHRDRSASYGDRFTSHAGFLVTNEVLYCHGPYETALGILFTTAGQRDRAVGYLEAGVARCSSLPSPSFGAIAQLELATTLRLRDAPGDAARSADLTDAAHRTTTALGMHGWARRAERLAAGDAEPWRIEVDA